MAKTQAESDLSDPKEMFAWMFAAGVPDPRGDGKFPNQPMIPPQCYQALSEMLYNMGARFVPEEQKLWVERPSGPERNFMVATTTGVRPEDIEADVAAMAVDQFPEIAAEVAKIKPEHQKEALKEVSDKLLANLAKLKEATANLEQATAAKGVAA